MSDEQHRQHAKDRDKKMAAPRSGQVQGGNAQEGRRLRDPKIAIPRCSNMPKSTVPCKPLEIIFSKVIPRKDMDIWPKM
jgi:hypothetical protein